VLGLLSLWFPKLTVVSILLKIFSFIVYSQCTNSVHFVKKQTFSVLNSHLYLVFIVLLWVHLVCSKPRDWCKFSYSFCLCFFLYCSQVFFPQKKETFQLCINNIFCLQNIKMITNHIIMWQWFYCGYINFNVTNIYFLYLSAMHAWGKCPTHLALCYGYIKYH